MSYLGQSVLQCRLCDCACESGKVRRGREEIYAGEGKVGKVVARD